MFNKIQKALLCTTVLLVVAGMIFCVNDPFPSVFMKAGFVSLAAQMIHGIIWGGGH